MPVCRLDTGASLGSGQLVEDGGKNGERRQRRGHAEDRLGLCVSQRAGPVRAIPIDECPAGGCSYDHVSLHERVHFLRRRYSAQVIHPFCILYISEFILSQSRTKNSFGCKWRMKLISFHKFVGIFSMKLFNCHSFN